MDIAAAIKHRRLAAGLTQAELGALCGVARGRICQLEADGHMPSIRTVLAIAHAVGVSASQLVRDAERIGSRGTK